MRRSSACLRSACWPATPLSCWLAFAALAAAFTLTGCESNIERSAKLERARLRRRTTLRASAPSISKPNPQVQVLAGAILTGREGDAVAVTLRNRSKRTIADAPIEISVKDARGRSLYRNDLPGIAGSLVMVPLLPPGVPVTWIDDQVTVSGKQAKVSVLIGDGRPAAGDTPQIRVQGAHLQGTEEVQGSVANRSSVVQHELVVNAVARRAGRIVAAGRAVLPEVGAGASASFQLYLIGDPRGGSLQVSAQASSLR